MTNPTDLPTAEHALSATREAPQSPETPDVVPQAHPDDSVPANPLFQPPRPAGYDVTNGPFAHGQCGRWWTGVTVGHCGACHREFSSGAFDRHQRLIDGVVDCSVEGLVAHPKPYGTLWRMPAAEGGSHWAHAETTDDDL